MLHDKKTGQNMLLLIKVNLKPINIIKTVTLLPLLIEILISMLTNKLIPKERDSICHGTRLQFNH